MTDIKNTTDHVLHILEGEEERIQSELDRIADSIQSSESELERSRRYRDRLTDALVQVQTEIVARRTA